MIANPIRKPLIDMHPRWKDFLIERGATFADGAVAHFGNPLQELQVATTGDIIADLSHRGLIRVAGADAAKFLQGQFTNDILQVDAAHSQLSGYCSPKGRLLALMRVFLRGDAFHLELPRPLLAPTLERLKKYVLISKVSLEDASDALAGIGLSGRHSEEMLERIAGAIPRAADETTHYGELTILRLPGLNPRFALYAPVEAMEKIWSDLDALAAPAGTDAWTRLDVLAGLPDIYPATVEEFVPQFVNLELLGGVSFKKGCYTGQEIVARLHYRGSVKHRLFLGHAMTKASPAPGTPLLVAGDDQAVGQIVLAAPDPEGGCDLQAVVAAEHWQNNTLHLKDDPEAQITLRKPAQLSDLD